MNVCSVCGFRWEEEDLKEPVEKCPKCGEVIEVTHDHPEFKVPVDLREFIEFLEEENELKRIKSEVDWNLELSHISKLNEERQGPALLFENVKGYATPVFTSAYTTPKRVAIALGMDRRSGPVEVSRKWMERITKGKLIKPRKVNDGPVMENVVEGERINLLDFPVPKFYPHDGDRYFGTAHYMVARDPEEGWVNLGTYRMQILDDKSLGVQILKGKDADVIMQKYRELGEKEMPVAAVIGGTPLGFLTGSTLVEFGTSEYEIIGALQGRPVEVIESDLTGLPIDSRAEIVVEGFIPVDPSEWRSEGPFGEYTGYYSGKAKDEFPKPWLRVERVMFRDNPIFWATTVGRPVTDTHMIQSINRTAELWAQLERLGVPGIESVYLLPESGGRFWGIISVKQRYPGHGRHAGIAAFATVVGNYGLKGVIVVDDDIRADDLPRVWWAMAMRYNPIEDTEIIKKGRSTPLDPSLPIYHDWYDRRLIVSRILIDATTPYEWDEKPRVVDLDRETIEKLKERWDEFGFDWTPE